MSTANGTPLMYKSVPNVDRAVCIDRSENTVLMQIADLTAGVLRSNNFYLGALMSTDGTVVYWVNETNPLP